ncbi:MAG: hypothetical protein GEU93_04835 [Propionibacteriales bacterium]|nr:hypothetical protein [Propionibacteriales bacterium]
MHTSRRSYVGFGPRTVVIALLCALALVSTACGQEAVTEQGAADNGDAADRADAEFNLKYTSIFSPGAPIQDSMDWWMDEVEERTDGRVHFERFYAASLAEGTDTIAALAEGRADVGYVVPAYTPGELPLLNVAMVPGSGEHGEAHARALEWLVKNNEHVIAEQEAQGIRIQTFMIIGRLGTVISPDPITTVSDLDGMTMRAIGFIAEALKTKGANPVAIEAQEAYESVQRGVIDGVQSLPLGDVPAQGLHEVAPWVVDLGLGHFGAGSLAISDRTWQSLPSDIQKVIQHVNAEFYPESAAPLTMEAEETACDTLLEAGGGVTRLPEDEIEQWRDDIGDSIWDTWRQDSIDAGASEEAVASVEKDLLRVHDELLDEVTYDDGIDACRERTKVPAG